MPRTVGPCFGTRIQHSAKGTNHVVQDVVIGVVIACYASDFCDVEKAVSPGNSIRRIKAGQGRYHPVRFPVAIVVYESIDL